MGLLLAACGGQTPAVSTSASTAASASAAASESASGAVSSLDAVKTATIQIEAEGTFQDPEVGTVYNAAGRGSGFIIDPSGIAVTNNHVVTGSALLKVWVGGESEPRNAKVLGVSECSDLAVIDIDGDGYPFLDWYGGDVSTGLDVYAAGFPLGDPEFTLTRGIVSKENADGETSWASVDAVVEHDATINPGNSGGPLVTADGQVVGVNYAGASETNQYYAINGTAAQDVVAQLQAGDDVQSIGVNGQAVNDGDTISGIWVSSVKSGSPADAAGVQGGDIITTMEGLVLSTDGTMSDYCDILRSHEADDTLAIEVLRFASEEVLEGQLNGRALETSFSFAQELGDEVDQNGGGGGSTGYSDFVEVQDDSGTIGMVVPAEWAEVDGSAWIAGESNVGPAIIATTSMDGWNNGWDVPGIFFGASSSLRSSYDVNAMLDANDFSDTCTYESRSDSVDPLYTGAYDVYRDCGGSSNTFVVLAAEPEDGSFIMLLQVVLVSEADAQALDQILNTYQLIGSL
jgi:serine protease Do